MAQTTALLAQYLPNDLCGIIISFFGDRQSDADVARYGLWEDCQNITNLYHGLYGACRSGHIPIVELMINMGANDFDGGLAIASLYRQTAVAELMIRKKKTITMGWTSNMLPFYYAGFSGSRSIVKLLIRNGMFNISATLVGACHAGRLSMVKFAIRRGATDFEQGLWTALYEKHIDVAKYLVQKHIPYIDDAFTVMCARNILNNEITQFLIDAGATECYGCRRAPINHMTA
jgi:ankyrin repeat protein